MLEFYKREYEMTWHEYFKTIAKITASKSKIVFQPLPEDDPKVRQPDITRAKSLLKWEPKVNRREGLLKTLEYFKKKIFFEQKS